MGESADPCDPSIEPYEQLGGVLDRESSQPLELGSNRVFQRVRRASIRLDEVLPYAWGKARGVVSCGKVGLGGSRFFGYSEPNGPEKECFWLSLSILEALGKH